jgi:diguanylate cyclase (GGDEF)-like protein
MSSNRVYRRHLNAERIRKELVDGRGSQWDSKCVDAMLVLLDNNRLPRVDVESDTDMVQQATTILTRVIDLAVASPSSRIGRDELTGLLTRDEGIESIQSAIYKNGSGIVMLFDIDHFHRINETRGFMVGDTCLRLMADVVAGLLPEGTAARVGADKFLLYVPDPRNQLSADELAKLFYDRLLETEEKWGLDERLSVSVGVAWVGTDKDRLTIVMDNAEKAVYVASQRGGNTWYCHRDDPYEDDLGENSAVDLNFLIENIRDHVFKKKEPVSTSDPELGKMYEFVSSAADHFKTSVLVLLFTVQSAYGVKGDIVGRDQVMGYLEKVIRENTRPGDFMTKFSSSQHAVLMMNLSMKDTESVTNRIIGDFLKAYGKREYVVHYDAAELKRPTDA